MYQAFSPLGPTILVDTTPRQADPPTGGNPVGPTSYRIRNISNADAWITWVPSQPGNPAPPAFSATAPTAATPQPNTLGLGGKQTEVFSGLPASAWFVALTGTFEVTPGEGM